MQAAPVLDADAAGAISHLEISERDASWARHPRQGVPARAPQTPPVPLSLKPIPGSRTARLGPRAPPEGRLWDSPPAWGRGEWVWSSRVN